MRANSKIFVILWVVALALYVGAARYSAPISCALHGHAGATIVTKDKLDVFDYVKIDFTMADAIVFEKGRVIGWIYSAWTAPSIFVEFKEGNFVVSPEADRESIAGNILMSASALLLLVIPILMFLDRLKTKFLQRKNKSASASER